MTGGSGTDRFEIELGELDDHTDFDNQADDLVLDDTNDLDDITLTQIEL